MNLEKTIPNSEERITTTELADYVFRSRRKYLGEAQSGLSIKSNLEAGRLGHEKLEASYNYLKSHQGLSNSKYLGFGAVLPAAVLPLWGVIIIPLELFLLALGLIFLAKNFFVARKSNLIRAQLGIGKGKIIYTDLKAQGEVLHSKRLPLSGKPDAIKKIGWRKYVPIEHKTGSAPGHPYIHHKIQLLAACVLVEENHWGRVPHGILSYPNGSFEIKYTKEDEELIKNLIGMLKADKVLGRASNGNLFKYSMTSVSGIKWQN